MAAINITTYLRYPADLGSPPYEKWILFEVRTGRHVARDGMSPETSEGIDRTIASVALYLPGDALKSTTSVTWAEESYGAAVGAGLEAAFQRGGMMSAPTTAGGGGNVAMNITRAIEKGATATSGTGLKQAAYNTATTAIEAAALAGLQGNVDSVAIAEGATGKTVNPRTDILFKNVAYREHSFSFKLIPRTLQEAKDIDTILNIFQYYSLPDYGGGSANFFIGYPYEFAITLFTQGNKSTHHLNTIGRSVLESFTVDHAGGDRVAFVDRQGEHEFYPAVTALEMGFKETRLLGRDKESKVWRGTNNGLPLISYADPRSTITEEITEE